MISFNRDALWCFKAGDIWNKSLLFVFVSLRYCVKILLATLWCFICMAALENPHKVDVAFVWHLIMLVIEVVLQSVIIFFLLFVILVFKNKALPSFNHCCFICKFDHRLFILCAFKVKKKKMNTPLALIL